MCYSLEVPRIEIGRPALYEVFFFFFFFIYLALLGLTCSTQDLLVAAPGIFSCGMRTLSCDMWDLVP